MDVPTPAASAEKLLESDMAEDICKLLEQTMLRYFPQTENDAGQPNHPRFRWFLTGKRSRKSSALYSQKLCGPCYFGPHFLLS